MNENVRIIEYIDKPISESDTAFILTSLSPYITIALSFLTAYILFKISRRDKHKNSILIASTEIELNIQILTLWVKEIGAGIIEKMSTENYISESQIKNPIPLLICSQISENGIAIGSGKPETARVFLKVSRNLQILQNEIQKIQEIDLSIPSRSEKESDCIKIIYEALLEFSNNIEEFENHISYFPRTEKVRNLLKERKKEIAEFLDLCEEYFQISRTES